MKTKQIKRIKKYVASFKRGDIVSLKRLRYISMYLGKLYYDGKTSYEIDPIDWTYYHNNLSSCKRFKLLTIKNNLLWYSIE